MTRPKVKARKIRLVKIDKEHQEQLANRLASMVNIVMERPYTEDGKAQVEYNDFLEKLWEFDELVDSMSELDAEQNGA